MVFLKDFFKSQFEKNQQTTKKHEKLPSILEFNVDIADNRPYSKARAVDQSLNVFLAFRTAFSIANCR